MGRNKQGGAAAYLQNRYSDRTLQIEKFAPLVKRIALHLKVKLPPSVELDDLIQSGMMGLMYALQNFEEGHGASFETYASIRIRGAMIDEMRASDWAPRSVHRNTRDIAAAITSLSHRLGREPKDIEIAAELKVSVDKYHQMLLDSSNSQMIGIEDLGITEDVISDSPSHHEDKLFEMMATEEFHRALATAISRLPEREQQVLAFYYDENLNLREIGQVLEVSESRVCQILSQTTARLRSLLRDWVAR